jgi:DNA-cytosine methyltransferase
MTAFVLNLQRPLKVLSLFSGIGGFDLGLEWTGGFKTIGFCEIKPFCQSILAKHWPTLPIYNDVRLLTARNLWDDGLRKIDAIIGGFPCQDLSSAGKRLGLSGERSGLWKEFFSLICQIRPKIAILENVPGLLAPLRRGGVIVEQAALGTVLGQLAEAGYDARWFCLSAADLGAPHQRRRVFVVAYPNLQRGSTWGELPLRLWDASPYKHGDGNVADTDEQGRTPKYSERKTRTQSSDLTHPSSPLCAVADPDCSERWTGHSLRCRVDFAKIRSPGWPEMSDRPQSCCQTLANAHGGRTAKVGGQAKTQSRLGGMSHGLSRRVARYSAPAQEQKETCLWRGWPSPPSQPQFSWEPDRATSEPVSNRKDRLEALGNAVVPQCAQVVGYFALDLLKELQETAVSFKKEESP